MFYMAGVAGNGGRLLVRYWLAEAGRPARVLLVSLVRKPETFTFLGFTHYCGKTRNGTFTIWRRTAGKRLRAKLKEIQQTLRSRMHEPVGKVGEWLRRVVNGYYLYHAVPGNLSSLGVFRYRLCQMWRQVLRRRSQKRRLNWENLNRLFERWLPHPRILHPYPGARFDATHRR